MRCKNKTKKVKPSLGSSTLKYNNTTRHITGKNERESLCSPSNHEKSKPLFSLDGCRISDLERISALEKLRRDASILYNYPQVPLILQGGGESFPDNSTNARTQTIIDAAIGAINRCGERQYKSVSILFS